MQIQIFHVMNSVPSSYRKSKFIFEIWNMNDEIVLIKVVSLGLKNQEEIVELRSWLMTSIYFDFIFE